MTAPTGSRNPFLEAEVLRHVSRFRGCWWTARSVSRALTKPCLEIESALEGCWRNRCLLRKRGVGGRFEYQVPRPASNSTGAPR